MQYPKLNVLNSIVMQMCLTVLQKGVPEFREVELLFAVPWALNTRLNSYVT
jgi:hypothetical protein